MPVKSKNYDKKIYRLVKILNYLDSGRKVSTRDLAEEFNVTVRTIQRDIELLCIAGFPIVSDGGRHSFMSGFSLKKMMLTEEDASLLSLLYEIVENLGENFKKSFQNLLRKTFQCRESTPFYIKLPQGIKLTPDFPHLEKLEKAIEDSRKVKITYLTREQKTKEYILKPFKIIFYEGFWYLLSQKEEEKQLFKFRLERIKDVVLLSDYFEMPDNLRLLLDESVNIWFGWKRDKKMTLKVDKEVAHFFVQKRYFPCQKIKKNKDGSLLIETRVSQYMEILPTILHWIPFVVVLEPAEQREEIKKLVRQYLKKI